MLVKRKLAVEWLLMQSETISCLEVFIQSKCLNLEVTQTKCAAANARLSLVIQPLLLHLKIDGSDDHHVEDQKLWQFDPPKPQKEKREESLVVEICVPVLGVINNSAVEFVKSIGSCGHMRDLRSVVTNR